MMASSVMKMGRKEKSLMQDLQNDLNESFIDGMKAAQLFIRWLGILDMFLNNF